MTLPDVLEALAVRLPGRVKKGEVRGVRRDPIRRCSTFILRAGGEPTLDVVFGDSAKLRLTSSIHSPKL